MKKITTACLVQMKQKGEKISMLTAYDFLTAELLDQAGVEILLIGDSLAMVVLGYDNTLSVTMEDMLYHTRAVARGVKSALVVGDMPFMSYQISVEETLFNAGRFLQAGAEAVKLEGGEEVAETVARLVQVGIPVMGHIGLQPQSVHQVGGFKVRGKTFDQAKKLITDAKILEEAGVFSLVLECIPRELSRLVTEAVSVPTIGIGAGSECDGQVLVTQDMVGLYEKLAPKFVKQYAHLGEVLKKAVGSYIKEVKAGRFPTKEHSFTMDKETVRKLEKEVGK